MRRSILIAAVLLAAACGPATAERVAVMGVDRLSGELSGQEVELPGTDLAALRGPAGMFVQGGASPECGVRRKVSGALVAPTGRCVTLMGYYAALGRARQVLLAAGDDALFTGPAHPSQ